MATDKIYSKWNQLRTKKKSYNYFRKTSLYCNNCGKHSHFYKDCKYPITSYGVMCVNSKDVDNIKYLAIRRRNSLSYVEFLRGRYAYTNISFLKILFTNMTISERELLKKYDFEYLWNKLWLNKRINDYFRAKEKFCNLKNGIQQDDIIMSIDYLLENTHCMYTEPEWTFPKGRRNAYESDKETGMREFSEETNYNNDDYKLLDIAPFHEEHLGTNNVTYKAVYYIGEVITDKEAVIDTNNISQINEIGDIGWFTCNEIKKKFRKYNVEKKYLISSLDEYLKYLYSRK